MNEPRPAQSKLHARGANFFEHFFYEELIMSHRYTRPAFMVAALIIAGVASAAQSNTLTKGDRAFIEKAAKGGVAEVELGNLAQQKAQNQQVKDFAARMVQDHSKANEELKSIASAKGVAVPAEMDKSVLKEKEKLEKLAGAKFDREYMSHMVKDHKKDVKEFANEAKNAKDGDVKNFAAATLPTLQEHLKLAQAAERAAKS
jgi:putative membrane protein